MLRIGSAQGFYDDDDVTKALLMIEGGHIDVVCFESLADLTLAILRNDMLKDPARGFTWVGEHTCKGIAEVLCFSASCSGQAYVTA
jgi:hypothetical protein